MIFLSGVCGMRTDALAGGTSPGRVIAEMTERMSNHPDHTVPAYRSGRPLVSDPLFRVHVSVSGGSGSASDDRFDVVFMGECCDDSPGETTHAARILRQIRNPSNQSVRTPSYSPDSDSPDTAGTTPPPRVAGRTPPVLPDDFLNRFDGIFFIIIHDRRYQAAHFISDRLGLRYLYFHRQKDRLWFATETKAFLSCPGFSPELSQDALRDFLRDDFIRGDKALLRGAELLPAGTVRTYDFREDRITDHRYWRWEDKRQPPDGDGSSAYSGTSGIRGGIKSATGRPATIHEAAEHLASLFRDAVLRRLPDGGGILTGNGSIASDSTLPPALGLSGGLDSRAILAALPDPSDAYLFTFGRRDSLDVTLAQRVSRLAGTGCDVIEIHADNWLAPRLEAVWWTDGHANLLHMHGVEALDTVASNAAIQLNGGVQNFIRGAMTADAGAYQFDRLRRFQRLGTLIDDRRLPTRMPFCDYRLLDFLQTLPDDLLRDDRLYRVMLLDHFPRFFRGIPYANTGYSLDARFRTLRSLAFRARRRLGLVNYALHDYPRWIRRQIPAFRAFLDSKDTRINDLGFRVDAHRLLNRANSSLLSLPECEELCRFLTLEVYLRCLDNPDNPDVTRHVLKQ